MELSRAELIRKLIDIHFERTNADLKSGIPGGRGIPWDHAGFPTKIYRIEMG